MKTNTIDRKSRRILGCFTLALLVGPALSGAFAQDNTNTYNTTGTSDTTGAAAATGGSAAAGQSSVTNSGHPVSDTGGGPESTGGQTNALPQGNNAATDTSAVTTTAAVTDTAASTGTAAITDTSAMAATDTSAMANSAESGTLSRADRHFMMKAAMASTNEVSLSQLAADHAASNDVKSFAEMMVTDHTKANSDLQNLASQKGVDISRAVAKGQTEDVEHLSGKTGADFDKDYVKKMVKAHDEAVSLFRKEASDGKDPDVVAFANKYLPTLSGHYDHAKQLEQQLESQP